MKEKEMVIMVGVAGCGKSTFSQRFLPYHNRVNLDSIHALLDPQKGFDKKNLGLARTIEDTILEDKLKKGYSVVIDNTNLTAKHRLKYLQFADKYGMNPIAIFFEPDVELAIWQNKQRERKVPDIAIRSMKKQYELPTTHEGFAKIINAENPTGLTGTNPAVFMDRDGVILKTHIDGKSHFINNVEDIVYIETAIEGMKEITRKGYSIYMISNQGGVGLGIMTIEQLDAINQKLSEDLLSNGINLKRIYCCTDHPKKESIMRKPNTGMIIKASRENNLDPTLSYMVGDMTSDIELGNRVKAKTILVETGFGGTDNKYTAISTYRMKDLIETARMLPVYR